MCGNPHFVDHALEVAVLLESDGGTPHERRDQQATDDSLFHDKLLYPRGNLSLAVPSPDFFGETGRKQRWPVA
jgi:hypothetical protein